MTTRTTNHFLRLSQLGYSRLVPIVPPGADLSEKSTLYKRLTGKNPEDARGKAPGIKGRWGWKGYDWMASEEVKITEWHDMGAGVGIKCGKGIAAIDADTLDKQHAKTILQTIEKHAGVRPPVRIGQYPKALYLVRTDPDFQYARVEFGERDERGRLRERCEILSEGRQFVAEGIHPKTGKPYEWVYGLPKRDDLPFVSSASLLAILDDLRETLPAANDIVREGMGAETEVDQSTLRGDPAMVEKAIHAMRNVSRVFQSREDYVKVAYALRASLPDDQAFAKELWLDWCAKWEDGDNDPEVALSDFDRAKPPYRIGAQWLFEKAEETADEPISFTAERWFDPAPIQAPLFPEDQPNPFKEAARKLVFTPFDEAADTALSSAAKPLIKGILDQGAMTILYGESNSGKTFVAFDMAYSVAGGLPWAGRKTEKLPVLYVAAEGGQGARKRAAALKARHGPIDGHFYFLLAPVNLLRADADLRPLVEAVRATGMEFGLIIIDTLSRAMAGGDENSSTDMGAMVKHLDVLRKLTGAHVLAVHHSGKDRARGARGHSLLRAATDTEIEIADRVISVTKQRDLDGTFESGFELDVMTLGVDSDGDPITSCTVRLVGRAAISVGSEEGLTIAEGRIVRAFRELDAFNSDENEGVSIADLADFMKDSADNMSENALRMHVKRLVKGGFLTKCRRGRWKAVLTNSDQSLDQNVFQ